MIISASWKWRITVLCAVLLGARFLETAGWVAEAPEDQVDFSREEPSTNATDLAECGKQLLRIGSALQEYRKRHGGKLPDRLADLVRENLITDRKILFCPHARRTGEIKGDRDRFRQGVFSDEQTYYSIEFATNGLQLFDDRTTTWREWKERQAAQLEGKKPGAGEDYAPVIRCLGHKPRLNLSRGGRLYKSGEDWEETAVDELGGLVTANELGEEFLFREEISRKRKEISFPPRDRSLPAAMVDLSAFHNARLIYAWQPWHVGNELSQLGTGVKNLGGREHDIRGVIQLGGKSEWAFYPDRVGPIPVDQKARAIHFIHATSHSQAPDTSVGHYLIRYADGATEQRELMYGVDLADWWYEPEPGEGNTPSKPEVVWTGSNRAVDSENVKNRKTQPDQKKVIRLYRTRWQNPRPDTEITSLDLVSGMSNAAPFVIAITLEQAEVR